MQEIKNNDGKRVFDMSDDNTELVLKKNNSITKVYAEDGSPLIVENL